MTKYRRFRWRIILIIAIVIGSIALLMPPPAESNGLCYVASCQIGGKNCFCCLLIEDGLLCVPCGDWDCPPPPQ